MLFRNFFAIAAFAWPLARAIPSNQPSPTLAFENGFDDLGWTPAPTEAPYFGGGLELVRRGLSLQRRDFTSGQLLGYFGPDNTCGYVSGSIGAALSCSTGSRCAAIAPLGSYLGAVGCCPNVGSGCNFITSCYDYAAIQSSKCNDACKLDENLRLCTDSSLPYCYGYSWPDLSATIWGCASSKQTSFNQVLTTFAGETDKRTWKAAYYTPSASGDSASGILTAASDRTASTNSASTSNVATASPSNSSSGSKTNIGAIVGGVVGGLAVLGAIAFGLIFLLLRKRKNRHHPASSGFEGDTNNPGVPVAGGPFAGAPATQEYQYGENKAPMVGTPGHSPPVSHVPSGAYDPRFSTFSQDTNVSSQVPPYHSGISPQQGAPVQTTPIELGTHETVPVHNAPGHQIFEAPGHPN